VETTPELAHGIGAVDTDVGGLALPGSCNSFR